MLFIFTDYAKVLREQIPSLRSTEKPAPDGEFKHVTDLTNMNMSRRFVVVELNISFC